MFESAVAKVTNAAFTEGRKASVQFVEGSLPDQLPEELPNLFVGRLPLGRELRQADSLVDPRKIGICRRVVPGVAPVRGQHGVPVGARLFTRHALGPSGRAGGGKFRRERSNLCEVAGARL